MMMRKHQGIKWKSSGSRLEERDWRKQNLDLVLRVKIGILSPSDPEPVEDTQSTEKGKLPIIDLFLNPNRSKELKETLKESENREGSVTHTKVTSNPFDSLD